MRYLLDTNISIYLIKSRSERFLHRMRGCPTGGVGVSVLTLAERQLWRVQKPTAVEQNQVALEAFLLPLEIANLSRDSTWAYGEIRADFEKQGCPIVPLDTLISTCPPLDVLLITNNTREFSRVLGLHVEDWTT